MCEDYEAAKASEVDGLKELGIWTIVNSADVPKDANVLGGRLILSLKHFDTPDGKEKVRYVAQGFDDHEKPYVVHNTSKFRVSSIRIVLQVASIMGFGFFRTTSRRRIFKANLI